MAKCKALTGSAVKGLSEDRVYAYEQTRPRCSLDYDAGLKIRRLRVQLPFHSILSTNDSGQVMHTHVPLLAIAV